MILQKQNKFAEGFIISEDDFNYIKDLYKFYYNKQDKWFFDNKYKKVVAYKDKNLFTNEDEIIFNLNWLAYECIITKSKKLLEIFRKYIENNNKYEEVKLVMDKIAQEDKEYIHNLGASTSPISENSYKNFYIEKQYDKLLIMIRSLL